MNVDNRLVVNNKLADSGLLQVYDVAGKLQTSYKLDGNALNTYEPNLQKGVYIVKAVVGINEISQRIIIK
jgi:hypothetical protein